MTPEQLKEEQHRLYREVLKRAQEPRKDIENIKYINWVSDGKAIGSPVGVVNTSSPQYPDYNTIGTTSGNSNWIVYPTTTGNPSPNMQPLPYYPPLTIPNPAFSFPPTTPNDQDGNKVIKAPQPSLEQVMIEIAKVLRDGGDILEIRTIFEKHKLKLVDHDGEVIFDPKRDIKLEEKNF